MIVCRALDFGRAAFMLLGCLRQFGSICTGSVPLGQLNGLTFWPGLIQNSESNSVDA